jgi:hypothetical protein
VNQLQRVKDLIKKAKEKGYVKDIRHAIKISDKLKKMSEDQLDLLEKSMDAARTNAFPF